MIQTHVQSYNMAKRQTDIKKTHYGVVDNSVKDIKFESQKQIQSRIDELVDARPFIIDSDYFIKRLRILTTMLQINHTK